MLQSLISHSGNFFQRKFGMEKQDLFNYSNKLSKTNIGLNPDLSNPFKKEAPQQRISRKCGTIKLLSKEYKCEAHSHLDQNLADLQEDCSIYGIPNFGNTCYLSVVLQIFFLIPSFIDDIKNLNGKHLKRSADCAIKIFLQFALTYKTGKLSEILTKASVFKNLLAIHESKYKGRNMHDAEECLSSVLTMLSQTMRKNLVGNHIDLTEKYFKIKWNKRVQCSNCTEMKQYPRESFVLYLTDLDFTQNISQLIEKYLKPTEKKCNKCSHSKAITYREFSHIPELFIINLQRTLVINRRVTKVTKPIIHMMELSLSQLNKTKTPYKLVSVINHEGESSDCGHYAGFFYREFGDSWFHCNDKIIKETTQGAVLDSQTNSYLLCYKKV